MAKKKVAKKKTKKSSRTVHVPVHNLIRGLKASAELQLAIVSILHGLPKDVLALPLPARRIRLSAARTISVGAGCECARS